MTDDSKFGIRVKSWIRKPARRPGTGTTGRQPRPAWGRGQVVVDSSAGQGVARKSCKSYFVTGPKQGTIDLRVVV